LADLLEEAYEVVRENYKIGRESQNKYYKRDKAGYFPAGRYGIFEGDGE